MPAGRRTRKGAGAPLVATTRDQPASAKKALMPSSADHPSACAARAQTVAVRACGAFCGPLPAGALVSDRLAASRIIVVG